VSDHTVPIDGRVAERATPLATRQVGSKEPAQRKRVDHHAAAEVAPVALGAPVARLDEVLSALDGPVRCHRGGVFLGKVQLGALLIAQRKRDREFDRVDPKRAGERPGGRDRGPDVGAGAPDEEDGDQSTDDLEETLHVQAPWEGDRRIVTSTTLTVPSAYAGDPRCAEEGPGRRRGPTCGASARDTAFSLMHA